MKFLVIIILSSLSLNIFAQDQSEIRGQVSQNDRVLENVVLRNLTTTKATATDSNGYFFIRATVGDTILFSQLGSVDLIKILTRIDFATSPLEIKM